MSNVALCADNLSLLSTQNSFGIISYAFTSAMATQKVNGATTAPSSSVEDELVAKSISPTYENDTKWPSCGKTD